MIAGTGAYRNEMPILTGDSEKADSQVQKQPERRPETQLELVD